MRRFAPLLVCAALLASCKSDPTDVPLSLGDACDPSAEDRCSGGFCLALDAATGVCSVPCDEDAACGSGFTCQVDVTRNARICKPGFACDDDASCPSGHKCDGASGRCFIPVERQLCSPCTADPQCPADGLCLVARGSGERFCTAPCGEGESCPDGFACRALEQNGVVYDGADRPKQCVPVAQTCNAGLPLCAPCTGDDECGDGNDTCVENLLTSERFCGRSCNPTCTYDARADKWINTATNEACESSCPKNFSCTDVSGAGSGPFQCVPNGGSCEGFCNGGSEAQDLIECGFGRYCDPIAQTCEAATDGRQCAPCTDDDTCNPPGSLGGASCVANNETGEAFCAIPCIGEGDCLQALGVGFSCVPLGEGSVCVPTRGTCVAGTGRLGTDCSGTGPGDCLAGVCLHFGTRNLCSAACTTDEACGDSRYRCCAVVGSGDALAYDCKVALGDGGGVCAPSGGYFGDDCDSGRPPCHDGHCLDIGTARVCTSGCEDDADCDAKSGSPGAFNCREAQALRHDTSATPEMVKVCFPAGGGEIGSDCSFGPAACADRLCIKKDSGNLCTKACGGASGCPAGWACETSKTVDGQELSVCLPPSAQ